MRAERGKRRRDDRELPRQRAGAKYDEEEQEPEIGGDGRRFGQGLERGGEHAGEIGEERKDEPGFLCLGQDEVARDDEEPGQQLHRQAVEHGETDEVAHAELQRKVGRELLDDVGHRARRFGAHELAAMADDEQEDIGAVAVKSAQSSAAHRWTARAAARIAAAPRLRARANFRSASSVGTTG